MIQLMNKMILALFLIIGFLKADLLQEAQHRVPPIIYTLNVPAIKANKEFELKFSLVGYHSKSYKVIVIFYGNGFSKFKTKSLEAYNVIKGPYKYDKDGATIQTKAMFYKTKLKLNFNKDEDIIVRFFVSPPEDYDQYGLFSSALISGATGYKYYDASGRKIVIKGSINGDKPSDSIIKNVTVSPKHTGYAIVGEDIVFIVDLKNNDEDYQAYIAFHTGIEYLPEQKMEQTAKTEWITKRALLGASPAKKYKIIVKDGYGNIVDIYESSIEVRISEVAKRAYTYAESQLYKKSGNIDGKHYVWADSDWTYCARFIRAVFGKDGKYSSAIDMYNHYNNLGLVKKEYPINKGDVVFLGKHSENHNYGHVGIADGEGNIISVVNKTDGVLKRPISAFKAPFAGVVPATNFYNNY